MIEPVTAEAKTPGARLVRARERLGWSPSQTAEKLHLDPRVVAALEADDFASLGAPVYVRGHLRRYAALVGESAADLETLYLQGQRAVAEPDVSQASTRSERALRPAPSIAPRALLIFAASLVVLALVIWAARRGEEPVPVVDATSTAPAGSASAAGSGATSASGVSSGNGAASGGAAQSGTTAPGSGVAASSGGQVVASAHPFAGTGQRPAGGAGASSSTPASSQSVAAVPGAEAAPPPPMPRRTRLNLSFEQPVTVTVTDASGKVLLNGIMEAGAAPSLRGRAPFTLALSNPAGVGFAVDDRSVFLTAGMRDTANLRVQLDASGHLTQLP